MTNKQGQIWQKGKEEIDEVNLIDQLEGHPNLRSQVWNVVTLILRQVIKSNAHLAPIYRLKGQMMNMGIAFVQKSEHMMVGIDVEPATLIANPVCLKQAQNSGIPGNDLHAEGWSHTVISAYLQTPRHRVYEVLKRWALFGHKGLEDIPQWHARKAGTREIDEIGKLVQETPELGAYRVRAALEQIGISLSQATCGRLLSLIFATRYTRHLDRHGYLRFQNWKLYGERGLVQAPVTVWIYDGLLKVEYQAVTLAQYGVE